VKRVAQILLGMTSFPARVSAALTGLSGLGAYFAHRNAVRRLLDDSANPRSEADRARQSRAEGLEHTACVAAGVACCAGGGWVMVSRLRGVDKFLGAAALIIPGTLFLTAAGHQSDLVSMTYFYTITEPKLDARAREASARPRPQVD
jgi:hypothetical protein